MFQPCTVTSCKQLSCAICHCCLQNICIVHLNEHHQALNSKLDPLVDEINALKERLQTMNMQKKVDYCRRKLEQWRMDCYQKIDHLFEQKCQELDELASVKITKQQNEISQIRTKLAKLINDQKTTPRDIDLLTSSIRYLEGQMNNIEQTCFQITIQPLIIDDRSITFKEKKEQQFDPAIGYPIHKTLEYTPGSWFPLASNGTHLLFHHSPNLTFVNRELNIIKQVHWPYAIILNMCWSSTLNGFIIMTEDTIYLVNDKKFVIENLLTNPKQNWLACACSDLYLFVSTNQWGSSIVQYSLSITIDLDKQWRAPKSCTNDECIESMVYNNETLALMIRNRSEQSIRIELKFPQTFDRIWSLRLDAVHDLSQVFRCCSLIYDEWLVINSQTRQLLHIKKFGILKTNITYRHAPHHASLFGENFLVIATDASLNFHKLILDT
jgi:hypothetical protein